MLTTGWADWTAEVEAAYQRLAGAGRPSRRRRAQHGRLAHAVDRRCSTPRSPGSCASTRRPSRSRPRSSTMLDEMLADGTEVDARHRQRHRRPRRRRDRLRRHAAAAAAVVHRRRPGADGRPLRRADDAAAAVHVAPGPRRRAGAERAPRRALRRAGRPPLARAQLPRGDAGLRPRRDHRRGGRRSPSRSPGPDAMAACSASIPSPSSGTHRDRAARRSTPTG